jgi:hypothetical protein
MDKKLSLRYYNGSFDDESMVKIDKAEIETPGFKNRIINLSKNFYGFRVNSTDEEIDYNTQINDIKGYHLDIEIINEPPRNKEEDRQHDIYMLESLYKLIDSYKAFKMENQASLILYYIEHRELLKRDYFGLYAKIKASTSNDKNIEVYDNMPINEKNEVSFKIGEETKRHSFTF